MLQGDHHGELRHHLWRLKYTELNEIFAFMTLRSLGLALVTIFIPIYLYASGFGVRGVVIYYLFSYLVELIFEFPVAIYIKRFGPKHMIAASMPFLFLSLYMFLSLGRINWPIWSMALVAGISLALFWQPYHYDFSRAKHRKKVATEVGSLYIILAIVGAMAPFVGGFIASTVGIEWSYALAIFIVSIGGFSLFKTSDTNFRSGRINFKNINIRRIAPDMLAYGGSMIETSATAQIWPLYLFLIVGSYEKVGFVTSAALLATVITTYYFSKKSDQGGRIHYVRAGGVMNSITTGLKVLVSTVPQAMGINIAKNISSSVSSSPFVSEYYIHADEESRSEYIHIMESSNDLAKVLYYLTLLGLLYILPEKSVLVIGLLLGAGGALLTLLMRPAKCEVCGEIKNKQIKLSRELTK